MEGGRSIATQDRCDAHASWNSDQEQQEVARLDGQLPIEELVVHTSCVNRLAAVPRLDVMALRSRSDPLGRGARETAEKPPAHRRFRLH